MQNKRKYNRTKYKYNPNLNMLVVSLDNTGMTMTHTTAREMNTILENTVSVKAAIIISVSVSILSFSIGFFL